MTGLPDADQAAATEQDCAVADYDTLASVPDPADQPDPEAQWAAGVDLGLDGQPAALCGCAPPIECQQHAQARQPGAWRYRPGL